VRDDARGVMSGQLELLFENLIMKSVFKMESKFCQYCDENAKGIQMYASDGVRSSDKREIAIGLEFSN
jgi:hypothetical protein